MALSVEVSGYGICQAQLCPPYVVFVISVQQPSFQGWTVYRRFNDFISVLENLQSTFYSSGSIPTMPEFDNNNFQVSYDI